MSPANHRRRRAVGADTGGQRCRRREARSPSGAAVALQVERYVRELRKELQKQQRPVRRTKKRKTAARKSAKKRPMTPKRAPAVHKKRAAKTAAKKTGAKKAAAKKTARKSSARRSQAPRSKKSSAPPTRSAPEPPLIPAAAIQLPERLRQLLESSNASYDVLTHRRAYTASATAEAQHVPGREMAKVVMLEDEAGPLMAVVPAPYRVSVEALRTATRRPELRLEREDEFVELFPECEIGAMPPFGNLYGVPVWVDERLAADKFIVFNAGDHEHTVRMAYSDFERLVAPREAAFSVR
jgi:Ala-tRNA(Pro) deacylase